MPASNSISTLFIFINLEDIAINSVHLLIGSFTQDYSNK